MEAQIYPLIETFFLVFYNNHNIIFFTKTIFLQLNN